MGDNVRDKEKIQRRLEAETFQRSEHASLLCGATIILSRALVFKTLVGEKKAQNWPCRLAKAIAPYRLESLLYWEK